MNILVLNAGSSSLKFALYSIEASREQLLLSGIAEPLGGSEAYLTLKGDCEHGGSQRLSEPTHAAAVELLLQLLHQRGLTASASAHRVVHGGRSFTTPVLADSGVVKVLADLNELAPLHNPPAVTCLRAVLRAQPSLPAVLHFDTGFHAHMPPVAHRYALPPRLCLDGAVRRYGFHGISYQWALGRLATSLARTPAYPRLVMCHLGAGASVCAVFNGRSIDTTMGFTPQEGLVMATRSGDVDPGLLLYLVNNRGYRAAELEHLLTRESGMLALSGISGDVRQLDAAAAAGSEPAQLALDIFAYRVRKTIGAYAAALGGLDALLFTGGIGQNSSTMRIRITTGLQFLGINLDEPRNTMRAVDDLYQIGCEGAMVDIWVAAANEELQMARDTIALLSTRD